MFDRGIEFRLDIDNAWMNRRFLLGDVNVPRRGTERVELSWILEQNTPMRRMLQALGATPYKTYRIYERELG